MTFKQWLATPDGYAARLEGHFQFARLAFEAGSKQERVECHDLVDKSAIDWADHAASDIDEDDRCMSVARIDSLEEMAEAIRARGVTA